MNLFDILFMRKTGTIKPDANIADILFARIKSVAKKLFPSNKTFPSNNIYPRN